MAGKGGKDIFSLFASGRKEFLFQIRNFLRYGVFHNVGISFESDPRAILRTAVSFSLRDLKLFRQFFKGAIPDPAFF
jgi:hypothetical protein